MKKKQIVILSFMIFILLIIINLYLNNSAHSNILKSDKTKFNNSLLAIMIEKEDGNWYQVDDTAWLTTYYRYNEHLTYCENGGKLQYDKATNSIIFNTSISDKCYVYFDKIDAFRGTGQQLKETNPENMTTDLVGNMYRYYGENPNNYICFGSNSCSVNDHYMYRIIGITEDGKIKIVKANPLDEELAWNTSSSGETFYSSSTINTELNASAYYTNEKYIPKNSSYDWLGKIAQNIVYRYGSVSNSNGYGTGQIVYNNEQTGNTFLSSVALPYLSDYYFALDGKGETNCSSTSCKSWLTPSETEWTMTYYAFAVSSGGLGYNAWTTKSDGISEKELVTNSIKVRPIIYLKNDALISGYGTPDEPYIVQRYLDDGRVTAPGTILEGTENISKDLYGGLYRFMGEEVDNNYICFGNDSCGSGSRYLYRIIGVTQDNKLKLIKVQSVGALQWNSELTDTDWPNSALYRNLNGSGFYTGDYFVSEFVDWQSRILSTDWYYNEINEDSYFIDGDSMYNAERAGSSVNAKIGLLQLSDYYYAFNEGGEINCKEFNCNSWLNKKPDYKFNKLDLNYFFMDKYSSLKSWALYNGSLYDNRMDGSYETYPVFYITNEYEIISGDGTLKNPYVYYQDHKPVIKSINLINIGNNTATFKIEASDDGKIDKYWYSLNGGEYKSVQATSDTLTISVPTKQIKENIYAAEDIDISVYVEDNTNNQSEKTLSYEYSFKNVGDMYRYFGESPNNYICINNTGDKCNNEDLYRIMGITQDNKLKLISAYEYVNNNVRDFPWHDDELIDVGWDESYLKNYLNTTVYDSLPSNIKNKIVSNSWYIGMIDSVDSKTGETLLNEEKQSTSQKSFIGLQYASDYLFSVENQKSNYNNWYSSQLNSYDSSWTMIRSSEKLSYSYNTSEYAAWAIFKDYKDIISLRLTRVTGGGSGYYYPIYPVFYLDSSTKIISGIGTAENPYRIE